MLRNIPFFHLSIRSEISLLNQILARFLNCDELSVEHENFLVGSVDVKPPTTLHACKSCFGVKFEVKGEEHTLHKIIGID